MVFRKVPQISASAKDEVLALALASGRTQAEAAKAAGVTSRTVRNKLQLPEFRALVASHRNRMTEEAYGTLAALAHFPSRDSRDC